MRLPVNMDEDLDDEEKTDTAVASSLAKIVNKRFAGKLSEEKVKEKFAKYARPANCEELRVHNVNSEIWKIVPTKSRKNDVKTAHLQILNIHFINISKLANSRTPSVPLL